MDFTHTFKNSIISLLIEVNCKTFLNFYFHSQMKFQNSSWKVISYWDRTLWAASNDFMQLQVLQFPELTGIEADCKEDFIFFFFNLLIF